MSEILQPTPEQIAEVRANALNAEHPVSWTWNESQLSWTAPIDPPNDGFPYLWNEPSTSWVPFPDYPRG